MNLELTKEECANTKVALITTAKRSEVPEKDMIALLMLAQKFNFVEAPPKKEAKVVKKP